MHYYILVYGRPDEIQEEINRIQFAMNSLGGVGDVRELKLFEIVFRKEHEKEILAKLSNPNPKIENLAGFIRHFCYGLKIDGQIVVFRKDERSHDKFKSPSVNILGYKEDNKHPDGREIF